MEEILKEVKKGQNREAIFLMNESPYTLEDVMREVDTKDEVIALFAVASRMHYVSFSPANLRR